MRRKRNEIQYLTNSKALVHKCPKEGWSQINKTYGLWIISSRRNQFLDPKTQTARKFEFYTISQLLSKKAFYVDKDGNKTYYEKGQGVVMVPDYKHLYSCEDGMFNEDTIRFTGPVADQLFNSGIIKPGIITLGIHRRLLKIMELAGNPSIDSQIQANISLQTLLVDLYFENMKRAKSSHINKIVEIVNMIQNSPDKWWTIGELAEFCQLSINQFRNVFKKEIGMTPKLFIDKVKMNKAAERLCTTTNTLASIAKEYGYTDTFHFSRRFKELMGSSPDSYRKNN